MPTRVKLQIFVSSTYKDLRAERQAAVSAILENGHIPAGMELFAAGNEAQAKVIKRWIDESDIFMLILGGRYGSIDPATGNSYTHMEYEYAVQQNKPLFAIVMTDSSRDARIKTGGETHTALLEQDFPAKWRDFRKLVLDKMSAEAEDHKDIRLAVAHSIRDLESRHRFSGWVPASSLPDTSQILADVAASSKNAAVLQEQNIALRKELRKLKAEAARRITFDGQPFEHLVDALLQQEVEIELGAKKAKHDLLHLLLYYSEILATGVSNRHGTSSVETELFSKVAQPLFVYGITERGKVPAKDSYTRFVLSAKGQAFTTELRVRLAQAESKPVADRDATPKAAK